MQRRLGSGSDRARGRLGVKIVNMSYTGETFSAAEFDAIKAAEDTLFVAAAGNEGADNDRVPSYPCHLDLPNVVCVTASGPCRPPARWRPWRNSMDPRPTPRAFRPIRSIETWA